jgi:hypothetical protein
MTGALWCAAFVAAGFALHPLHVQSVAWAAERKDLLSAFFWIAAMGVWLRYARRPLTGRYLAAVSLFVLGLLSKPMVVTLPLILLLLDIWPLGRLGGFRGASGEQTGGATRQLWRRALLEKAPLLVLSAISAALTVRAQASGGAIHGEVSPLLRVENALFSLVAYLGKTLWPVNLSVFYPYPADGIPWWRTGSAALLIAAITAVAARGFRRAPWSVVGWGWYLVSLLPVLGIVQVGSQGMADRYTYLPLVGIFLAVAWGLGSSAYLDACGRRALAVASCALLAAWAAGTWVQIGLWRNGVTLFTHSQAVTPDNATVRYNLGRSLLQEGQHAEALVQLERAVALDLLDEHAPNDLGVALSRLGRRPEAIAMFRRAILINPSYTDPYLNLGIAYLSQNDRRSALAVYRELLAVNREVAAQFAVFIGPAAAE